MFSTGTLCLPPIMPRSRPHDKPDAANPVVASLFHAERQGYAPMTRNPTIIWVAGVLALIMGVIMLKQRSVIQSLRRQLDMELLT